MTILFRTLINFLFPEKIIRTKAILLPAALENRSSYFENFDLEIITFNAEDIMNGCYECNNYINDLNNNIDTMQIESRFILLNIKIARRRSSEKNFCKIFKNLQKIFELYNIILNGNLDWLDTEIIKLLEDDLENYDHLKIFANFETIQDFFVKFLDFINILKNCKNEVLRLIDQLPRGYNVYNVNVMDIKYFLWTLTPRDDILESIMEFVTKINNLK